MPTLNPPTESYPDDGRLVGTDAIFSSPNVIPPRGVSPQATVPFPPREDGIPAPSIYRDERGEIHNVKVNNAHRINILYTKAGYMRSGDLHPNAQCDFVFAGKVKVWTLAKDGTTTIATYGKHDFISIPRGTPHVFEFVEDTVMAEWWEPQGFQGWFYRPLREIVDRCNAERSKGESGEKMRKGLVVLRPCKGWGTSTLVLGAAAVGAAAFSLGMRFGSRHR